MNRKFIFFCLINFSATLSTLATGSISHEGDSSFSLSSEQLKVTWQKKQQGWYISEIITGMKKVAHPSGAYTILYKKGTPAGARVDLDIEGRGYTFFPSEIKKMKDGSLLFSEKNGVGEVTAHWKTDSIDTSDLIVEISLTAANNGYYSIATPTIAVLDPEELAWGMIPGAWYGRELVNDRYLAAQYSQGLPSVPTLARENSTMTLSPLLSGKDGITFTAVPEPGTAADPWPKDSMLRKINKVGMSTMNRHNELSPVVYAPVLGQEGSYLQAGETFKFKFRYIIQDADWFTVFNHVVNNIYEFKNFLTLQKQRVSLSERLQNLAQFLSEDKRSAWTTWDFNNLTIGANGSKNADIGALYMLAKNANDTVMQRRIPFVRNYKLAQQQTSPGFFQYSATGEYPSNHGNIEENPVFFSEVGNWIEPLYTTYYTLMDMGNMLLFNPEDKEIRERMRLAADKLMSWQKADGGWDVAYDRLSNRLAFPDLKDLRPTWYGLLVAYKTFGDTQYLDRAKKGADWLIVNGVDKGYYLGVCGDARNVWDFATAQCAQAFLDLYAITKEDRFKNAAIETARIYATTIYTHPVANGSPRWVNGKEFKDWEISQVGLSVEHINGTASSAGPILISSFTSLFVRIYELTGESLFLDMARAGSRGRHAFIDPYSSMTTYYWDRLPTLGAGAREFPHHAYWQIGWITDYLMAEIHLRSEGKVSFPSGYMTPKVGPHVSYGFAEGTVYGKKADLLITNGGFSSTNPYFEYITAKDSKTGKIYLMILSQSPTKQTGIVNINTSKICGKHVQPKTVKIIEGNEATLNKAKDEINISLPAWGFTTIELSL
ncbi:glycerophosphoryl diester phosphodiesterase [Parapedobacter deserti]|uniref:Glycerophosphoryl diester phosphodiesterase n=1 Tax=Parapedobacter deserti TaxID=1912957 RepID=A0ABV7JI49_9SPHI